MGSFLLVAFLVLQEAPPNSGIARDQSIPDTVLRDQVADVQQPASPPADAQQSPQGGVQPVATKPSGSAGKVILHTIWSDQKAIWTSPLQMNRKDAVWWAVFGGSTAVLIATDSRTSNVLPNTPGQISVSTNVSRIGAVYTTFPTAGAFYLYGRAHKDARARETGALGSEALLDSLILVSVLKLAAGRERPNLPGGDGRFFKGKDSFPSGHSILTWSLASVISHEYKGTKAVPVIAYSLASVVSFSRVAQREHFISDVVAGASMGWFVGRFVFQHHANSNLHGGTGSGVRNRLVPEIYPSMDPRSGTYALSLAWNP